MTREDRRVTPCPSLATSLSGISIKFVFTMKCIIIVSYSSGLVNKAHRYAYAGEVYNLAGQTEDKQQTKINHTICWWVMCYENGKWQGRYRDWGCVSYL